jgi:large subunit ribosomal protein L31
MAIRVPDASLLASDTRRLGLVPGTLDLPDFSGAVAVKTDVHPSYNETVVRCSCGNTFTTRSTKGGELHIELCNECHPFFTGKQKLVDTGGRVERFNKRYGARKSGK